jgi:hypothetical protein
VPVIRLVGIEQHAHHHAAPVRHREPGDDRRVGERVNLGQHLPASRRQLGLEHGADLVAWGGLRHVTADRRQRSRPAPGKRPVLLEDRHQASDLGSDAGLEHVVMVAVAVRAPVHASDHGLAVGDQELDVVDLMAAVVHRIEAFRHAQPVQRIRGTPARDHRRICDHPDVHASGPPSAQGNHQVGPAQLVHLHQDPPSCRLDEAADQREDTCVLPEPNGLGTPRARRRLRGPGRRRRGLGAGARQQADGQQQRRETAHSEGQGRPQAGECQPSLSREAQISSTFIPARAPSSRSARASRTPTSR